MRSPATYHMGTTQKGRKCSLHISSSSHAGKLRQTIYLQDCVAQLREDVTRFRYGDEQHLDEALTRIFQFGRQKGIPRRSVGYEAL